VFHRSEGKALQAVCHLPTPVFSVCRSVNFAYREQLFPRVAYRRTFDVLLEQLDERTACRQMVGLLALAHDRACEAELAQCLAEGLDARRLPNLDRLRERFAPDPATLPDVHVELGSLDDYNVLLSGART
jgi:hypothetical protein